MEYRGVDGRIILKQILNKQSEKMWTGFIIKCGKYLNCLHDYQLIRWTLLHRLDLTSPDY
jgi:hypothetical protein